VGCQQGANLGVGGLFQWDGVAWSIFAGGVVADIANTSVRALMTVAGARGADLIVGGAFSMAGSTVANGIARYSQGSWSRLTECPSCQGLSGPVLALQKMDDGRNQTLIAAGYFRAAGNARVNYIARWNGESWQPLGAGLPGRVYSLGTFDDGSGTRLYASGGNAALGYFVKWDNGAWTSLGAGLNNIALTMKAFDDGTGSSLYVGGLFTTAGNRPALGLAKWDGSEWTAVDGIGPPAGSPDTSVLTLETWNDGFGEGLVVGGHFQLTAPPGSSGIALWRNQQWSALGTSSGNVGTIGRVVPWPPSAPSGLLAFGHFNIGSAANLAFFNGVQWLPVANPFGANSAYLRGHTMATSKLGGCDQLFIYNTGEIGSPDPVRFAYVWNGAAWNAMGLGLNDAAGTIWGIIVPPAFTFMHSAMQVIGDSLYVAGDFTQAGGLPAGNIAIWNIPQGLDCAADADHSGVIDVDDLIAVILQWGACPGICSADSAPCGGDGAVTVDDLLAVITRWGPCRQEP
jgi:hypothetical protein